MPRRELKVPTAPLGELISSRQVWILTTLSWVFPTVALGAKAQQYLGSCSGLQGSSLGLNDCVSLPSPGLGGPQAAGVVRLSSGAGRSAGCGGGSVGWPGTQRLTCAHKPEGQHDKRIRDRQRLTQQ